MAVAQLRGEKFRIISQPATNEWCGDCDDDPPTDGAANCLQESGSAMVVLIGAEEDGEFAMCKRHLEHFKKEGAIIEG